MNRRELWIRVSLDDIAGIQMAVVTVRDNKVTVSDNAITSLVEDGSSEEKDTDNVWQITYPVMAELLVTKGYRMWEEKVVE